MPTHESLFADTALARRLELTDASVGIEAARVHAQLHPESGATAEQIGGGHVIFLGIDSPFTQAIGLGMEGPVGDADMERVEEFFSLRGVPTRIEYCPLADPSLRVLLARREYMIGGNSNMLVRRVRAARNSSTAPSPVQVQRCTPFEGTLWANTVAAGFAEGLPPSEENIKVLMTIFQKPNATCVLARVDGESAGGGAISAIGGVAAFYGASTLVAYRRRGVQTAIIHALLACAAEAGCDIAYTVTQPASVSQRIVERQGFRVAYTRTTMVRDLPQM